MIRRRTAWLCCAVALAFAASVGAVSAQDVPVSPVAEPTADTLGVDPVDLSALQPPAPIVGLPGERAASGDGTKHPIRFSARDSLVVIFGDDDDPNGDVGTLYGNARTQYDDATLTAHEIELFFQRETFRARGISDEAVEGRPHFERGTESFTGRELSYDLATQRGRVVGARTAAADGYIHGGVVVQSGQRITYAQDVVYTSCEYEDHMHWGIHTHRMKVVDGEWVYTGAARLHILGIPTPIWLPFGFFPATEGRRSGPLPPDYGEQLDLGFYIRNVGYYWAISDYFDLQATGGFYTSGSYEGNSTFRYARRYAYDGALQIGYRFERRGEAQDPNYATQQQGSVRWNHNQTLDAAGTARLSGSVDLRTSGFAQSIAADYDQRVNQSTTSSLNFQKRWRAGRSLGVSYRQNLNLTDGSTNMTLPSVTYSEPRFYPFRPSGSRGRQWYEQIALQYSFTGQNTYQFSDPEETGVTWLQALFDYDAFAEATGRTERFDLRATHNVPLSASFSVRQIPLTGGMQLDLNPSLTYREEWFASRREARVDDDGFAVRDEQGRLVFDTVTGFTPVRQATFNVSASTRAFGTFPLRLGAFQGLRHEMRPSVNFSYAPDFEGAFWNRTRTVRDTTGELIPYTVRQDISAQGQPQQFIGMSLGNVFQTRSVREDTTGAVQRRTITLLNLDLSSGYDLARDSLNWRDVSLRARTTIADQVSVSLSAQYSPYAVTATGTTLNRSYFSETGRPLRFTRATLNASTQLRGSSTGRAEVAAPTHRPPHFADLDDPTVDGLYPYDFRRADLGYVDFTIPWSLGLDFNYGITRNFVGGDNNVYATLNSSFDLGLTRSWRVSGRSGFDFEQMEFVPTQITVLRDLHCWEMSFTWLPFGQVRAFSFSIYVKSGHLRDLLRLDVPNVDRTRHF